MSFSEVDRELPATNPVDQPRERAGLSIGRIINGAILLIHIATFITALCVVGLVGNLMGRIAGVHSTTNATQTGTCPFYAGKPVHVGTPDFYYPLGPNGVCLWFIAGHTILAIAAIVFFVVGIVRIVFAMDIGFGTIAELIATPILFVLAFVVALSVSIGILITCSNLLLPEICSHIGFPTGTLCQLSNDICWYDSAKSAESAAWANLIFLSIFFAVSIARLVIFIRRRKEEKRRRHQLVDCGITDDQPPAPV